MLLWLYNTDWLYNPKGVVRFSAIVVFFFRFICPAVAYLYRSFSLTWPSAMQISLKKKTEIFYIRKEFNPLWIFSAHQHGRRDVMYHWPG